MANRKRDYKAEYARRIARGLALGLSRSQARGHPGADEPLASQGGLQPPTYSSRLEQGLKSMREGASLTASARLIGVSRERLKSYLLAAGVVEKRGHRWLPTKGDPRPRTMLLYSRGKAIEMEVADRQVASLVGRYMSAVGAFLESNDPTYLAPFVGRSVEDSKGREHLFETRPNVLYRLDSFGTETFEQVYRISMGA